VSTETTEFVVTVNHAGPQAIHKISLRPDQFIVIGRSWQNDIVVNDEYIDPSHLKLLFDAQGTLHAEDLNTKNGTRLGKRTIKAITQYSNGDQLNIGDSTISVYKATESVAPALRRDTVQKLSGKYHSIVWYVLAILAAATALAINHYLLDSNEITKELVASNLSTAVFTGLGLSLLAGLMSKLFRQKTMFGLHFMFLCWAFLVYTLVTLGWNIAAFNMGPGALTSITGDVLFFAVELIMVFGLLSMISRIAHYKRFAIALVAFGLPAGFQLVSPLLESEYNAWSDRVSMNAVDQPPMFQFKSVSSVESHLLATDKLFTRLEKEVSWSETDSLNNAPAVQENELQVSESK